MRKSCVALTAVLALIGYSPGLRAQEDKPLPPGWLSLDSSVGLMDNKIAEGKGFAVGVRASRAG